MTNKGACWPPARSSWPQDHECLRCPQYQIFFIRCRTKKNIFYPCYVFWIQALILLVYQELSKYLLNIFKLQQMIDVISLQCSAYDKYKFLSLKQRSDRVQNVLWDALKKAAQLLVLNETVVCELCAVCCTHEGISTVATAEALNSSKAPDLTYRTFAKGGLLRNWPSWPDLSFSCSLLLRATNIICGGYMSPCWSDYSKFQLWWRITCRPGQWWVSACWCWTSAKKNSTSIRFRDGKLKVIVKSQQGKQ